MFDELDCLGEWELPCLLLIMGAPDSKKTLIGKTLAEGINGHAFHYGLYHNTLRKQYSRRQLSDVDIQGAAHDHVGKYLLKGEAVVYIAQNLSRAERQPLLQVAQGLKIPAYCVWPVLVSAAIDALGSEESVLAPTIYRFFSQCIEPPTLDEGFQKIVQMPLGFHAPQKSSLLATSLQAA